KYRTARPFSRYGKTELHGQYKKPDYLYISDIILLSADLVPVDWMSAAGWVWGHPPRRYEAPVSMIYFCRLTISAFFRRTFSSPHFWRSANDVKLRRFQACFPWVTAFWSLAARASRATHWASTMLFMRFHSWLGGSALLPRQFE